MVVSYIVETQTVCRSTRRGLVIGGVRELKSLQCIRRQQRFFGEQKNRGRVGQVGMQSKDSVGCQQLSPSTRPSALGINDLGSILYVRMSRSPQRRAFQLRELDSAGANGRTEAADPGKRRHEPTGSAAEAVSGSVLV